ncbi:putative histone-lysine N-methyltransferase chromatin regulator PHD family [Lupinus albus]|uniref:Putative histone-lysine N-methyltransferase chromatin regulator PHD family n=1 Tax=Lupinus albus TaxID=3870 RepID=A0A6A4Q3J1_LUPAL|nr:putative histone-lysine N-methyltransferase chromatin regulator PHD family [Lupinus albus]
MAPATSSQSPSASQRHVGFIRRTQAPQLLSPPSPELSLPPWLMCESLIEVMVTADYELVESDNYSDLSCEKCGSGELPEELLLCDKCDKGFHMKCLRPIAVRIPIGSWFCPKCSGQKVKRVRSFSQKKIYDFFGIQVDPNVRASSQGKKLGRISDISYQPVFYFIFLNPF